MNILFFETQQSTMKCILPHGDLETSCWKDHGVMAYAI